MNFFNTDKLTQGKAKVDTIFDSADRLGLDIIRVNHKKPGAHISGFSGFEVPKVTTDHSGMNFDVIIEKGMFHCYPDKMLNRHGFILDTTVHRAYQRRGIGTEMLARVTRIATERGLEWLHVDYDPHLKAFYEGCGYVKTDAGLLKVWAQATA